MCQVTFAFARLWDFLFYCFDAVQILVGSIFLVCYPLNVNLVQTFSMCK